MISLLLVVIIVASAASLARLAVRAPRSRFGRSTVWRLACLLGVARIGALWVGNAAYRDAGWPQGIGYLLQLTGLPEIYLARGARADNVTWLLLASALLAAGSVGWASLLVWVGNRIRPPSEAK